MADSILQTRLDELQRSAVERFVKQRCLVPSCDRVRHWRGICVSHTPTMQRLVKRGWLSAEILQATGRIVAKRIQPTLAEGYAAELARLVPVPASRLRAAPALWFLGALDVAGDGLREARDREQALLGRVADLVLRERQWGREEGLSTVLGAGLVALGLDADVVRATLVPPSAPSGPTWDLAPTRPATRLRRRHSVVGTGACVSLTSKGPSNSLKRGSSQV